MSKPTKRCWGDGVLDLCDEQSMVKRFQDIVNSESRSTELVMDLVAFGWAANIVSDGKRVDLFQEAAARVAGIRQAMTETQ